jgi:hypothetical protein
MTSRRSLLVLAAIGLGVLTVLFGLAAHRPAAQAAAWFAAIAAGAAVVGLALALETVRQARVAVRQARPGYEEIVRRQAERPRMTMTLQVIPARIEAQGEFTTVSMNERTLVQDRRFDIRIILHNEGDGVLRWGILNIQVPWDCSIEPDDDERKGHYVSRSTGDSGELEPGRVVPCHFTVAERDFPPGHHFLYHAHVSTGTQGVWPIAAVLDGYPKIRVWTRAEIQTP